MDETRDEIKYKNSIDNGKDFSGSQSSTQVIVSNCFEPDNRIKSDNGETIDQMESCLTEDLESVDLNDTSNDCLERNSPNVTDSADASVTDLVNAEMTDSDMTDSPTSLISPSQTSKKKK